MNISEFKMNYLNHYLFLEQDFKATTDYVTIDESNYNTYSVAYLKLLLTIGSEIDVMLTFLSKLYQPNTNESGFGCSKIILKYEPDIQSLEVNVKNTNISIFPWKANPIPDWWTVYNEIKHNRYEKALNFDPTRKYYQYANLQNVLTALAALFSLELYAYRFISIKENLQGFVPAITTIFSIKNSHWENVEFGNGIVVIDHDVYIET